MTSYDCMKVLYGPVLIYYFLDTSCHTRTKAGLFYFILTRVNKYNINIVLSIIFLFFFLLNISPETMVIRRLRELRGVVSKVSTVRCYYCCDGR